MEDIDNYEELENGVILFKSSPKEFRIIKLLIILIIMFFLMLSSSVVICLSNTICKQNIPTIYTLLNDQTSSPYMVLSMTAGLYVFLITSFVMYIKVDNVLVIISSILVYLSICLILFIFPFAGWGDTIGGIICFIITFFSWMIFVIYSTRKSVYLKLRSFGFVCIVFFFFSNIVYIVLRFLNLTDQKSQIGLMFVEIIGVLSIIGFIIYTIIYIKDVKVTITP